MFNAKLSIVRKLRKLRICVLVSVHPSGIATLFSASFSPLARGSAGWLFWTRCCISRVPASGPGINLTRVTLAGRTLFLSVFHKVRPVILSISPAIILESCALNAGLPIGFSAVIIWAGVVVPPPLLPPLPLPLPGHLGSVAAGMLRPLIGMLRCISVGSTVGRFFGGFDKWYYLLWRLFCLDWLWTKYELKALLDAVLGLRVVPGGSDYVLQFFVEALLFSGWCQRRKGVLLFREVGQVGVGFREVALLQLLLMADLPV